MFRGIIFHLIPLLVPILFYFLYLYFINRAGGEKTIQGRYVAISFLIGLILMAFSFLVVAALRDDPADGIYVPPRYEDGKIIDSVVLPKPD
jgi:hypothetical protein